MRTERAQLQYEVDILSQRLNQELLVLKDDLKGMFNDRKMAVRMDQRTMDSKVSNRFYPTSSTWLKPSLFSVSTTVLPFQLLLSPFL